MKVAIMGAGLSGLACAISLEKYGITPHIYESRSMVGDRFVNGELFMALIAKPIQDCVSHLADEFGIFLHPVNMTRSITIYGPNEKAVIEGRIGHANIRGRDKGSLESHLSKQVKAPIAFNSQATYEDLLQEHTHVVLATGDSYYAQKLSNYDAALSVSMKGELVEGKFDPYSVITWIDNDLAPKGYSYFIPLDESRASMVIAYPDFPDDPHVDIHQLYDKFRQRAIRDLGQPLPAYDQFEINHYTMGSCRNARIGNTFFVGNNFGCVMPFLGFGQFCSLLTGAYAAYDLCGKGDYEKLTKPIRESFKNSLVLRKGMEELDNKGIDSVVKLLATPAGTKLFNSGQTDMLKIASHLLSPLLKIKELV
ncbi:MAG: FAD-dependent dehydrogenase [Paenibacillaceae bacterium]|jgi:flavin-dependent dehydrogenase|nr:FAD-dependent dehydrogenase [Paenibacillaceae bacterium]